MVFVTRYLDLFTNYVSLYNTCMKIFFIGSTFAVVYLMRTAYWKTYDIQHDTFRVQFVLGPCLALALLINEEFSFMEVRHVFSVPFAPRNDMLSGCVS